MRFSHGIDGLRRCYLTGLFEECGKFCCNTGARAYPQNIHQRYLIHIKRNLIENDTIHRALYFHW